MHVRSISISNIRCFGSGPVDGVVELSLRTRSGGYAGWTVVAGRNGAGKTAFLQAIACALSGPRATDTFINRLPDPRGWMREGQKRASAEVQVGAYGMDDWDQGPGGFRKTAAGKPLLLTLRWAQVGSAEPTVEGTSDRQDAAESGPWAGAENGWFAVGYGIGRRLGGVDSEQRARGRLARFGSLFDDELGTSDGLSWLQQKYTLSVAWKLLELSETGVGDLDPDVIEFGPRADQTIRRVRSVLNDSKLLPAGHRVEIGAGGLVFVKPDGLRVSLASMSHGYRVVVGLVLDLLSKLAAQVGGLAVARGGDRLAFVVAGVVLIDEVDLHLHPSWQSEIGLHLTTLFPNVQFIVTTHSAFACHNADCLIRLGASRPGEPAAKRLPDSELGAIVNGDVDDIVLSELFGLTRTTSRCARHGARTGVKVPHEPLLEGI